LQPFANEGIRNDFNRNIKDYLCGRDEKSWESKSGGKDKFWYRVDMPKSNGRKNRFLKMIPQPEGEKVGTSPGSIEKPESAGTVMNAGDQGPLPVLNVCERDFKNEVIQKPGRGIGVLLCLNYRNFSRVGQPLPHREFDIDGGVQEERMKPDQEQPVEFPMLLLLVMPKHLSLQLKSEIPPEGKHFAVGHQARE
jgi:hypothetical protein